MVCDKEVCERWCVANLCVTKMCVCDKVVCVCDKVVCERWPRKVTVDVAKRHASHAKRRWVSPSVMPATQSGTASRATNGDQARHQTQPSVISTTPATQNEGGCRQVPRLPRETTVDVAK